MKYIGVYDSGIGGLTTVKAIREQLPDENIVFLADSANMPYGTKTNEEIISLSLNDAKLLSHFDLKALVIACNTSDSIALKIIQENYSFPVFGVINSTVNQAIKVSKNKIIGVLATLSTINNNQYEKQLLALDSNISVINQASPCLASMIEQGDFLNDDDNFSHIVNSYLNYFNKQNCDTVILGCTHYDVIKQFCEENSSMNIISSSRAVAATLKDYLKDNNLLEKDNQPDIRFYCTGNSDSFLTIARNIIPDIVVSEISE